jgi:hypothetical protein
MRRLAARENGLAHEALSLSLSPTRTLVTPYCKRIRPGRKTTRRPQVPLCCFPPFVFCLAPAHLGWDTQRQFTRRSRDPPGSKRRQLARQVGACCMLTNSFPSSSRWVVSSNLSSPGRCFVSGVSSSCPSTAATTWYSFLRRTTTIMAAVSPPAGGGIDDVFPPVAEEQHPGLSRHLPRHRRRRRGNHGQAGGGTSLAVERVDDAGAPAGDTSGVDLASETKTSVVSPQHTNPKQTDDASTLVKDLLGVSLVPETTVQSIPDATSSPPVDQEVPSVSHPMPFRFSCDPPSNPASVDAFIKAHPNPLGYHMRST